MNFIVLIVIIIIIIIIITIIISLIILAIIIVPKVFSYMYNAGDMQLSLYGRPICRAFRERYLSSSDDNTVVVDYIFRSFVQIKSVFLG